MIKQLNPPIPMDTPKGPGQASFLIDYSMEQHLFWVVFIDETREIWTFNNKDVRVQTNLSMGRGKFKKDQEKKFDVYNMKDRPL